MGESWMQVVQRVYRDGKSKNSSYKFKQAMVDAKKVYKHGGPAAPAGEMMGHTKSRKHHRKSKKHKKHGKKTRKHKKRH
jgi:hypothetical protein